MAEPAEAQRAVQASRERQLQRFKLDLLNRHADASEAAALLRRAAASASGPRRAYKRTTLGGPFFLGEPTRLAELEEGQAAQLEGQLDNLEQAAAAPR